MKIPEGSDVDLLVNFEQGRSLLDQVGLIQDLKRFAGMSGGCSHGGWFALVYKGQGPEGGKGIVKDDRLYLIHILERILKDRKYTNDGYQSFMKSSLQQDAVIRNLEVRRSRIYPIRLKIHILISRGAALQDYGIS
jgi:hypothetical protein